MSGLILTEEEKQMIARHREEQAQKDYDERLFLRRIITACEYSIWLHEEGAGSTFSTFCDDFGYVPIDGENRAVTYKIIMNVRHDVWNESIE